MLNVDPVEQLHRDAKVQASIIDELRALIGLDCGDQGCRFAISRTGMRTNGGCRCNPQGLQMERDEFRRKYHEAMDIMTAWKNIDHASAVAQLLKTQQDLAAMERALETCQKQCHLAIEGRRAFRTGFREVRSERDALRAVLIEIASVQTEMPGWGRHCLEMAQRALKETHNDGDPK